MSIIGPWARVCNVVSAWPMALMDKDRVSEPPKRPETINTIKGVWHPRVLRESIQSGKDRTRAGR